MALYGSSTRATLAPACEDMREARTPPDPPPMWRVAVGGGAGKGFGVLEVGNEGFG